MAQCPPFPLYTPPTDCSSAPKPSVSNVLLPQCPSAPTSSAARCFCPNAPLSFFISQRFLSVVGLRLGGRWFVGEPLFFREIEETREAGFSRVQLSQQGESKGPGVGDQLNEQNIRTSAPTPSAAICFCPNVPLFQRTLLLWPLPQRVSAPTCF